MSTCLPEIKALVLPCSGSRLAKKQLQTSPRWTAHAGMGVRVRVGACAQVCSRVPTHGSPKAAAISCHAQHTSVCSHTPTSHGCRASIHP